jgi:hypothetical protein
MRILQRLASLALASFALFAAASVRAQDVVVPARASDARLSDSTGTLATGREPPSVPGDTVRVPQDRPTIQQAVDAAEPGGLVLVSPGVYDEAVIVRTPFLTIRGTDRNTVILDGRFEHDDGISVLEVDGVSIENRPSATTTRTASSGMASTGTAPRTSPRTRTATTGSSRPRPAPGASTIPTRVGIAMPGSRSRGAIRATPSSTRFSP